MTTTITITTVHEDRISGARRWRIGKAGVAALLAWDGFDATKVRGSRGVRKDGTIHFTTGGGYAILDDLLGGNGDGTATRRAEDAGFRFDLR